MIVSTTELPDFNFSLNGLMRIRYGGMLSFPYLDKKNKPERKVIITDTNGIIDLSKLQLLGFTLISILDSIFYLFKENVLNDLSWDS
jgi:hypothetical protein